MFHYLRFRGRPFHEWLIITYLYSSGIAIDDFNFWSKECVFVLFFFCFFGNFYLFPEMRKIRRRGIRKTKFRNESPLNFQKKNLICRLFVSKRDWKKSKETTPAPSRRILFCPPLFSRLLVFIRKYPSFLGIFLF